MPSFARSSARRAPTPAQVTEGAVSAALSHAQSAARQISIHDRRADDPRRGFQSSADFFNAVRMAAFSDVDQGRREGTLLPASMLFGSAKRAILGELEPLRVVAAVGTDETAANEGQYGGFLVPLGFAPNLLRVPSEDPIAALTTPIKMELPIVQVPARVDKNHSNSVSGGLILTRKRQATVGTSSLMSFEQVVLDATRPLFGLSYATAEVVQDSPIAFTTLLGAGFADEYNSRAMTERLFGIGSAQPLGVMNSPALITIAKETGQASKTIQPENIDKMVEACWKYHTRGAWVAQEDLFRPLTGMTRSVGVGGSVVNYLTQNADGQWLLLGRPIFFSEFAAALGTTGDIVVGSWSEYLSGVYQPMQNASSVHVRYDTNERVFKFWVRATGAPWWRSTLTPKNSSVVKSPYVALATRG